MRRSDAWGLDQAVARRRAAPAPRLAEHVVWVEGRRLGARPDGRLVLLYHLLWELTHVVFEHPGLLEPEPPCAEERVHHLL
jgi:hypothetical protein